MSACKQAAEAMEARRILEQAPVSIGPETRVTQAGDYRFFARWRSDPFFFDTLGALNNLQFTATDFPALSAGFACVRPHTKVSPILSFNCAVASRLI